MVSKDLIAASSRPLVLSILARGESYGYAILQEVKRISGGELEWTDGMLYPVLHKLERDELVKARWVTAENGRRRKVYRLSVSGSRELKKRSEEWVIVNRTLNKAWRLMPCSS